MPNFAEIATGLRHPSLLFRAFNRAAFYGTGNKNGISVFEEDWDTLIILDACRYDSFRDTAAPKFSGTLSKVQSRGAATREWVEQNFSGRDLHDTVYVSANGWYHRLKNDIGSSIHDARWVYSEDYRNDIGTVEPHIVADAAVEMAEKYPHKRLLIHFVQPHAPFLGPTGEQHFTMEGEMNAVELMANADGATAETLQKAYEENLQEVTREAHRLVRSLAGKTVISADHGELLGERYPTMPMKNYGHPVGIHVQELVDVPWFICEHDSRRSISSEPPEEQASVNRTEVREHLRQLGYAE